MRNVLFCILILGTTILGMAQQACDSLMTEPVNFFNDGTVRDRNQVYAQLRPLIGCEVRQVDAELLFRGSLYGQFMSSLARKYDVTKLSYGDVRELVISFRESDKYQQISDLKIKTDELASREALYENWTEDEVLFRELGSSEQVIRKVKDYLKNNPNPDLTYLEILQLLKS